jgi:AhpD family alkylhydroperoxidase
VKLRASQINGCAYCVDLHCADARKKGETERRLYGVAVWHDTPFFTPRERVALEWTEALTLISQTHAPDDAFSALGAEFSPAEMVNLSLAIGTINTWNRLSIGFRASPPAERVA